MMDLHITLADLVRRDIRVASVFDKHGLDFSCHGDRTLADACEERQVDSGAVIDDLLDLGPAGSGENFDQQDIDSLCDYIEKECHGYLRTEVPVLTEHLRLVCEAEGSAFAFLPRVAELFAHATQELLTHIQKEELLVFPYVRELVRSQTAGTTPAAPIYQTIRNPISVMEFEHEMSGEMVNTIRRLTTQYTAPEGASAALRNLYTELKEFESKLHIHVHLENNIVFPKTLALEKKIRDKKPLHFTQ